MPLPNIGPTNTGSPRMTAQEGYSPDTSAITRMGASVNDLRKLQDQNQAIAKLLDNVASRLGNITNVRTNIQSATFEALGNNFISRGISQMTSIITDSLADVLSPAEEEGDEDPTTAAIKKQTALLTNIDETVSLQYDQAESKWHILEDQSIASSNILEYSKKSHALLVTQVAGTNLLVSNAQHPKALELLHDDNATQHTKLNELSTTLKSILRAFTGGASADPTVSARPLRKGGRPKKLQADDIDDVKPVSFTRHIPSVAVGEMFDDKSETEQPKEAPKQKTSRTTGEFGKRAMDVFEGIRREVTSSRAVLDEMLVIQRQASTHLLKISAITAANDIEDERAESRDPQRRSREAVESRRAKRTEAQPMQPLAMRKGVLTGATDLLKTIFSKSPLFGMGDDGRAKEQIPPEPTESIVPDAATGAAAGYGLAKAGDALKKGWGALKSGGKTAMSTVAKVGGKRLAVARSLAIPAAAAGLTLAGIDTALGSMGVGEGTVNESQDDANWAKMSAMQKFESGPARAIEKLGSFTFLDNVAKQAQLERIKKETEYLNVGKEAEHNLNIIEQNQKTLSKPDGARTAPPTTNIISNNNSTTTNILPTRAIVKNTDDSFNRYITSTMGKFA